jgi:Domain of unknown function (DUF1707)
VAILHHDLRASDRDREQTVALLKAHFADGRLSETELAWRSDAAYRAVGLGQLRRLTADLPAPPARRRAPVLPLAVLALALATWLVIVPLEVTLVLVLLFGVAVLVGAFLLAPVWIPLLLAFIAYRVIRARVTSCR